MCRLMCSSIVTCLPADCCSNKVCWPCTHFNFYFFIECNLFLHQRITDNTKRYCATMFYKIQDRKLKSKRLGYMNPSKLLWTISLYRPILTICLFKPREGNCDQVYSWHSFDVFFYLTCLSLSKVSILSTADTPLIYFSMYVSPSEALTSSSKECQL
jgi:hypothetical protein